MVIFYIIIAYLLFNVGLFSDDMSFMAQVRDKAVLDVLFPKGVFSFASTPLEHITHYIWYPFFSIYNPTIVSLVKIFYASISFYMISRFFGLFTSRSMALLVAFLFMFYPSHDATIYWFIGYYLTLSFAFIMFSYYLAETGRMTPAYIFSFMGSFISYGSPPVALGLSILFFMKKEVRKAAALVVPNVIYLVYYLYVSTVTGTGVNKVSQGFDILRFCKYFIFQAATSIDAIIGPSFWLKVYYSIASLLPISGILGIVLVIIIYRRIKNDTSGYDKRLVIAFSAVFFLSMFMFALTGLYPQMAFGLGNRVTIFGSLLASYLCVFAGGARNLRAAVIGIILFSILGASCHWKDANRAQNIVIKNIMSNKELKGYSDGRIIFVSGNQYSMLGPFSNIELLSEGPSTGCIFKILFEGRVYANPLNRRYFYKDGYLNDTKYDERFAIDGYMVVYDSVRDKLFKVDDVEINDYIDSLPDETRHWAQLFGYVPLKDIAVRLMPRLKYAERTV